MKNLESLFGKFGMTLDDFPTTLGWFRDDLFDRFRPARNSGLNRWIKRFFAPRGWFEVMLLLQCGCARMIPQ